MYIYTVPVNNTWLLFFAVSFTGLVFALLFYSVHVYMMALQFLSGGVTLIVKGHSFKMMSFYHGCQQNH